MVGLGTLARGSEAAGRIWCGWRTLPAHCERLALPGRSWALRRIYATRSAHSARGERVHLRLVGPACNGAPAPISSVRSVHWAPCELAPPLTPRFASDRIAGLGGWQHCSRAIGRRTELSCGVLFALLACIPIEYMRHVYVAPVVCTVWSVRKRLTMRLTACYTGRVSLSAAPRKVNVSDRAFGSPPAGAVPKSGF